MYLLTYYLFNQKYSKTVIYLKITVFCFNIFKNIIYSCDGKAEISDAITPVISGFFHE